jgi:hypothetical protein
MLRRQFTLKLEQAEDTSPILVRIAQVIEVLEAERLLAVLGGERGPNGRDDYPNRALWHCLVAFGCLGVRTVPEGLRYLELSESLQRLCGIESRVQLPSKHALYRFERRLAGRLDLLAEMFAKLVRRLAEVLPGFGERLATDSTKVHSLANGKKPAADTEASWKKYEHRYTDETGTPKKSVVKWFGYKLHLVVDREAAPVSAANALVCGLRVAHRSPAHDGKGQRRAAFRGVVGEGEREPAGPGGASQEQRAG